MNLSEFAVTTQASFQAVLEAHTDLLKGSFPRKARKNWGAARKALNIFLRDVVYLRPLCTHYCLSDLEMWLELPLDSNTYDGLAADPLRRQEIPAWPGVKNLDFPRSVELQAAAAQVAKSLNTSRVHLDVLYWRKKGIDELGG